MSSAAFNIQWHVEQSRTHPGFWIAMPCVPGGRARVMATDDFGNLYEPCPETARITQSLTRIELH